ncbi:MAG: hydroxypyruvate isomerase family protein [Acetobacteraceae bacterium]|nr:hydroxypyruvate isomerase family protein [Acetobacteraceae bacterium]
MPRFAANLSMMFNEVPFLDRFGAARRAGFEAAEFLFPYEHPASEVRKRVDDAGLAIVLFNMPPGDWAAGERGLAGVPGRQAEFRDGVARALDYAQALSCPLLHCMAGIVPSDARPGAAANLYVANLAWAAEQTSRAGVRLAIEPINHRDMPGYLLHTTAQGAGVVEAVNDAVGAECIGLQLDLYHCQVSEGDLTRHMEALLPITAHVQIADVPGRHEPGTGEIAWGWIFRQLDALGYKGWVGCEYRPANETVAGLVWREQYAT